MFRYKAAVAAALLLGATAVATAAVERAEDVPPTAVVGANSHDVMPSLGGGIELHACRGVDENGPYNIVEFGPDAAGDASGVQLIVDEAPADACAHLVVFTQPEPTQAL